MRVKYIFMDNGVIRQVTQLPIDRHVAVQGDSAQYFSFFVRAGLPASRRKHLYPIFPRNPDRFQGACRDGARF